jgi:hypothetical protein
MYTMKPLHYFYVWSPKYEIFHHILKSSFAGSPHFQVHDVFVPQEVFDASSYKEGATHFLDGNSVKYQILVNILEKHPGETIVFSDADTVIENPEELRTYLETFIHYDIVYARSTDANETELSAGFGMFRSSPQLIDFVKSLMHDIHETKMNDMEILNKKIHTFAGTHSLFQFPQIIQTQHYQIFKGQYLAIQITCSNHSSSDMNLFEKLVSVASLLDISDLVPLIPENVLEAMLEFYEKRDPQHYLLALCKK